MNLTSKDQELNFSNKPDEDDDEELKVGWNQDSKNANDIEDGIDEDKSKTKGRAKEEEKTLFNQDGKKQNQGRNKL